MKVVFVVLLYCGSGDGEVRFVVTVDLLVICHHDGRAVVSPVASLA